jgi:hypothetical protein
VFRLQPRAERAVGRRLLAEAFARGELTMREVLDTIVSEQDDRLVLLTPEPLAPAGRDGAGWRYGFADDLAAADGGAVDPLACRYRLTAELADGGEVALLELTPARGGGEARRARPLIAGATAGPNPFNPAVVVRFELERGASVALLVHDARGRFVAEIPTAPFSAGAAQLRWDGRDARGRDLPSGTYFLTVQAGGETRTLAGTLVR